MKKLHTVDSTLTSSATRFFPACSVAAFLFMVTACDEQTTIDCENEIIDTPCARNWCEACQKVNAEHLTYIDHLIDGRRELFCGSESWMSDVPYNEYCREPECIVDQTIKLSGEVAEDLQSAIDGDYTAPLRWAKGDSWAPSIKVETPESSTTIQIHVETQSVVEVQHKLHVYKTEGIPDFNPDFYTCTDYIHAIADLEVSTADNSYTDTWTKVHIFPPDPEWTAYPHAFHDLSLDETRNTFSVTSNDEYIEIDSDAYVALRLEKHEKEMRNLCGWISVSYTEENPEYEVVGEGSIDLALIGKLDCEF